MVLEGTELQILGATEAIINVCVGRAGVRSNSGLIVVEEGAVLRVGNIGSSG